MGHTRHMGHFSLCILRPRSTDNKSATATTFAVPIFARDVIEDTGVLVLEVGLWLQICQVYFVYFVFAHTCTLTQHSTLHTQNRIYIDFKNHNIQCLTVMSPADHPAV